MARPPRKLLRYLIVLAVVAAGAAVAPLAFADAAEPVRSMTFNVCGASTASADCKDKPTLKKWTEAVSAEIVKENTDVVGLQELCFGQWASLRSKLKEYKPVWVSTISKTDGCGHWGSDKRFGIGVFVKTTQEPKRYWATLDSPSGQEKRAVLCAKAPIRGVPILSCTTHLATYIEPDNGVSQVLGHIDAWKGDADLVLTADANAAPAYAATDALYERYLEADSTDTAYYTGDCAETAETCRSGEPTTQENPPRKIDFVFTTTADAASMTADARNTALSDHHILRATTHL